MIVANDNNNTNRNDVENDKHNNCGHGDNDDDNYDYHDDNDNSNNVDKNYGNLKTKKTNRKKSGRRNETWGIFWSCKVIINFQIQI